jgi:UDP-arabinose 4-epimerase
VYDNLSRGHRPAVKWGPLIEADLADEASLARAMKEHRIDAVMHFAAFAYVGESMLHPGMYFHNNSVNSFRLIQAMSRAGVGDIVFSSSCATYGHPQTPLIDETHPQAPVNVYGESKLIVEKMLRWHGQLDNIRYVILRYFNAAGADPDGELGENHTPETHLIPLALEAAQEKGRPLGIFGTDYPTPDGTAIRDYIHVTDLAAAHLDALSYLLNGGSSRAFNLGTGQGHSVRQVIAAVGAVTGRSPAVKELDRRPGDPPELVADASRARATLGWIPSHSSLPDIVQTAFNWQMAQSRVS